MSAKRVRVAASSEVREGKLLAAHVAEQKLVLSRIGGKVYAAIDRCPHMGLSIAKGRIENGVVTCPWHNSRFEFCTGRNMDWASAFLGVPLPRWTYKALAMGKSPAPLRTTGTEEIDGEVFICI